MYLGGIYVQVFKPLAQTDKLSTVKILNVTATGTFMCNGTTATSVKSFSYITWTWHTKQVVPEISNRAGFFRMEPYGLLRRCGSAEFKGFKKLFSLFCPFCLNSREVVSHTCGLLITDSNSQCPSNLWKQLTCKFSWTLLLEPVYWVDVDSVLRVFLKWWLFCIYLLFFKSVLVSASPFRILISETRTSVSIVLPSSQFIGNLYY